MVRFSFLIWCRWESSWVRDRQQLSPRTCLERRVLVPFIRFCSTSTFNFESVFSLSHMYEWSTFFKYRVLLWTSEIFVISLDLCFAYLEAHVLMDFVSLLRVLSLFSVFVLFALMLVLTCFLYSINENWLGTKKLRDIQNFENFCIFHLTVYKTSLFIWGLSKILEFSAVSRNETLLDFFNMAYDRW